jgi:hypothetical protein
LSQNLPQLDAQGISIFVPKYKQPELIAAVKNPVVSITLVFLKNPKKPGDRWLGYKENDLVVEFWNVENAGEFKPVPVVQEVLFDEVNRRVRIRAQFGAIDSSMFKRSSDRIEAIEDLVGAQIVPIPGLGEEREQPGFNEAISELLSKADLQEFSISLNNGPDVTVRKGELQESDHIYFYNLSNSRSDVLEKFIGHIR